MHVTDAASAIGLVVSDGEVTGTIDQEKVLGALAELTEGDPDNTDLYGAAVERVRDARSAGVEVLDAGTRVRPGDVATTQLRYRSEMADLFTDLAIDVGLRRHRNLVTTG